MLLSSATIKLLHHHFVRNSSNNPGQNIWNKVEKSSKTGQVKKSLISTFACFLTAIAKVQFLEGRLGAMCGYKGPSSGEHAVGIKSKVLRS